MEFERQQVICDTFDSYILINPLSIVYIFLILIICTSIPACRSRRIMPRLRMKTIYL
jgi:hypothetical protein